MGPFDEWGDMGKSTGQHRVNLREWLTTIIEVAAIASIVYGAGAIYAPAGWIVAGVLVLAASIVSAR